MRCRWFENKKDFFLDFVDGQNVVKSKSGCLNDSIFLNETAAFLWSELSKSKQTKEQLLNKLLSQFDISTVLALNDIDIFVKTLNKYEILDE